MLVVGSLLQAFTNLLGRRDNERHGFAVRKMGSNT